MVNRDVENGIGGCCNLREPIGSIRSIAYLGDADPAPYLRTASLRHVTGWSVLKRSLGFCECYSAQQVQEKTSMLCYKSAGSVMH